MVEFEPTTQNTCPADDAIVKELEGTSPFDRL